MLDMMPTIEKWQAENLPVVLATVVKTWGSSPRKVGAKMAFTATLDMSGSVSGGCIEAAVIEVGLTLLEGQQPRKLHFGVSDDTAWDVGLACGGEIDVFIENLDNQWWQTLQTGTQANRSLASALILSGAYQGRRILVDKTSVLYAPPQLPPALITDLAQAAQMGLSQRRSSQQTLAEMDIFIDCHLAQPTVVVVGGAHVAVALEAIAKTVGHAMVLIDPRRAFATPERFPDVSHIYHDYPQQILPALGLDEDMALVILTHDPKIDDPAIVSALRSPIGYIGVMSSRSTHAKRLERLRSEGFSEEQLSRIHAPIGLDIQAQTPEEIALCIMAEIIAVRNAGL